MRNQLIDDLGRSVEAVIETSPPGALYRVGDGALLHAAGGKEFLSGAQNRLRIILHGRGPLGPVQIVADCATRR